MNEEHINSDDPAGSSFNLTTALLLLVMLLVVIVGLLTYMLFEANGGLLDSSNARYNLIRCIPLEADSQTGLQSGSLEMETLH